MILTTLVQYINDTMAVAVESFSISADPVFRQNVSTHQCYNALWADL